MMLNGEVLVQAPPESLIKEYGSSSLEQVFLKLCVQKSDELEEDAVEEQFMSKNDETRLKGTKNTQLQEIDTGIYIVLFTLALISLTR